MSEFRLPLATWDSVAEWYTKEYPTDELGAEIDGAISFSSVINSLIYGDGGDVYDVLGVGDSIVRERVFERLAEMLHVDYDAVYYSWMADVSNSKRKEYYVWTKHLEAAYNLFTDCQYETYKGLEMLSDMEVKPFIDEFYMQHEPKDALDHLELVLPLVLEVREGNPVFSSR